MVECSVTEVSGVKLLNIKGRIDSISCGNVQEAIDDLILIGERTLVANLEGVSYISSAGLRVFLAAQKQLKKVGGEIMLLKTGESVYEVFRISGFSGLFRTASSIQEIESTLWAESGPSPVQSEEREDLVIHYLKRDTVPGDLFIIGSQENQNFSGYTKNDVVTVRAGDIRFGAGLAAIGEDYDEYKHYFGEAIVLERNLFFYPAVRRPALDFMLCQEKDSSLVYHFLNGFGFNADYRIILSFEAREGFVSITDLIRTALELTDADLLGIVILGESKGLLGMHLKQVPIMENRPQNGREIFHETNFADWFNFPVEPIDINNIIAGTGIAARAKERLDPRMRSLIPEGQDFHFHGVVFSKGPLNKRVEDFDAELKRVMNELDGSKVQHILGQSRFHSGMIGIMELKG